jgi:hypothetical protein
MYKKTIKTVSYVFFLVFALTSESAIVVDDAASAKRPAPCSEIHEFSQFDFWLGKWTVHTGDGTPAGVNRIEKQPGGCVLVERWTSIRGGTGISLNYYDPRSNQWVQDWIGGDGSLILIRGGLDADGSMLLEGTLTDVGEGTTSPFRGRWTLLEDGRVRQAFDISPDDGASWAEWFVGFYSREADSE